MDGKESRPPRDHPVLRFVLNADRNLPLGVRNLADLGRGGPFEPMVSVRRRSTRPRLETCFAVVSPSEDLGPSWSNGCVFHVGMSGVFLEFPPTN